MIDIPSNKAVDTSLDRRVILHGVLKVGQGSIQCFMNQTLVERNSSERINNQPNSPSRRCTVFQPTNYVMTVIVRIG